MHVFHWIYVSKFLPDVEEATDALAAIRCISQIRNEQLGATGTLIFTGRRFAQYLEGNESAVMALRASIERDPRHGAIVTLGEGLTARRRFSDWSLSYTGRSSFVDQMVERSLRDDSGSARTRLSRLLVELASAEDG